MFNKKFFTLSGVAKYPETMYFIPCQNSSTYLYSYDGASWDIKNMPTELLYYDYSYGSKNVVFMEHCATWVVYKYSTGDSIDIFYSTDLITWKYVDVYISANEYGYNYSNYILWYDKTNEVCVLIGGAMHCYTSKNGKDWYFGSAYSEHGVPGITFDCRPSLVDICSDGSIFFADILPSIGYIDSISSDNYPDYSKIFYMGNTILNTYTPNGIIAAECINDYYVVYIADNGSDQFGYPTYSIYTGHKVSLQNLTRQQYNVGIKDFDMDLAYNIGITKVLNSKVVSICCTMMGNINQTHIYDLTTNKVTTNTWQSTHSNVVRWTSGESLYPSAVKDDTLWFTGKGYGYTLSISNTKDGYTENYYYDSGLEEIPLGIWSN